MYKDSNILSPITLQRLNSDEAENKIEETIDEAIQDKYKESFIKAHERKKKAMYNNMSKLLSSQEAYLSRFYDFLTSYQPKKIDFTPEKIDNNDEIMVLFSDLHI